MISGRERETKERRCRREGERDLNTNTRYKVRRMGVLSLRLILVNVTVQAHTERYGERNGRVW